MRQSTRVRLIRLVVCLALATAWAVLVVPGTAVAKGKPGGGGGGTGGGKFETQGYWVWFSQDLLGAFEPEGPPPEGSASNGTDGGSMDVSAGSIGSQRDQRMIVNTNATCLTSFWGAGTNLVALATDGDFSPSDAEDFAACFPDPSGDNGGTLLISADGKSVDIHLSGLSYSGKYLGYWLTIDVSSVDSWDPLGLPRGETVVLTCGEWRLTTSNPKKQSKGCSARGDFSDDGVAITVKRWTQDEQDAQDACE